MNAKEFGEYLKGLRREKKLTIRQLDLYSGVSNSYISQMERGARGIPSPDILKKLAKPLGVSYEELMAKAGYFDSGESLFEDLLFKAYKFFFRYIQDNEYSKNLLKHYQDHGHSEEHINTVKQIIELKNIEEFYINMDFANKVGLLHDCLDMLLEEDGSTPKNEAAVNKRISDKYNNLPGKKREVVDNMIDMLYSDQ